MTVGSTRSLQGVDSNSPTYLAEMKFEGQAFKLIHMVDLFTDHEKIKLWHPEWQSVTQVGPVVDDSMVLLNVEQKMLLKRFCFTTGNKLHIYFSTSPLDALDG